MMRRILASARGYPAAESEGCLCHPPVLRRPPYRTASSSWQSSTTPFAASRRPTSGDHQQAKESHMNRYGSEFFGTGWLVLGGCGSAVLAAALRYALTWQSLIQS